jgi:hypothetical protein
MFQLAVYVGDLCVAKNTACLWGTMTLLIAVYDWTGRNGVTGVSGLSQ